MKTRIKNIIYILPAVIMIYACQPEIEVPQQSSGSADFSTYIAVGNSLTAGISDNGLYAESQMQSYPKLIGQQMDEISSIDFVQPDVPGNGSGYLYVADLDFTTTPPTPTPGLFPADPNWLDQLEGPFNNLGVSGIRVKDITAKGYGASPQANPHFYRMLGGKDPNMTYLELVQESQPTFFTSWIGNNDVLGYALAGGALGTGALTDPDTEFKPKYDQLISALKSNGAKGVVATIPDITLAPFFNTIPWNGLVLDETLAALANLFYSIGIDSAIESKVQVVVIALAVTGQAVSTSVIPSIAQGVVYQQAYQQAIDGGATPAEADAIAIAFIATVEGQAAITQLETSLNAELRNHLLGDHSNHQALGPLYAIIDNELATNTALQEGIAQGIADLTLAYENDLLPPGQKAALDAAIAQGAQQQIDALKAAGIYPVFQAGPNGFVIEVPLSGNNLLGIRQMKEGEFVLLTALLEGQLAGTKALEPKPTQYILTSDEVENINEYTDAFNDIIRGYASSADIALFESNELLEKIKEGIWADGVNVNGSYLTGGVFSLDGVHMTPRGYAIVANRFIETINENFGAKLSPLIINNYRAVVLP